MLMDVAARIRELREITGLRPEEMAKKTDLSQDTYEKYESGLVDLPFTFIHKCAILFGVELTELLEGSNARLKSYTVTRKGKGRMTAHEPGIEIKDLAPLFRHKIVEPFWVTYTYSEAQQNKPINLITHAGQEFDIILSGSLKIQIGLNASDTIDLNTVDTTTQGLGLVRAETTGAVVSSTALVAGALTINGEDVGAVATADAAVGSMPLART